MKFEWQGPLRPNEKPSKEEIKNPTKKTVETQFIASKSDEKPEDVKKPENVEQELSPEVIEMIMGKVQDINEIGTAYSVVTSGRDTTKNILKDGFLGNNWTSNKESWAKKIRKEKKGVVFFNIVGTERDRTDFKKNSLNEYNAIAKSYYFKQKGREIAIIFDLKPFRPASPHKYKYADREKQEGRTFRYARDYDMNYEIEDHITPSRETAKQFYEGELYDEYGGVDNMKHNGLLEKEHKFSEDEWALWIPKVDTERGFTLSYRIPPRLFKGIVFQPDTDYLKIEKLTPERMSEETKNIALIMKEACGEKTELYLPIYDKTGNLLWPKQMSYEEVKKFVAERAEKKAEVDSETSSE
ncbi:MAG: hypothetical protein WC238_00145 [Parcubacteria group bacterium]|jgi:hypothetical protein